MSRPVLARLVNDQRISKRAIDECIAALSDRAIPRPAGDVTVRLDYCLREIPRPERDEWVSDLLREHFGFSVTGTTLGRASQIAKRRRPRRRPAGPSVFL